MAHDVSNRLFVLRDLILIFLCVVGLSACSAGAILATEVFAGVGGALVGQAITEDGIPSKPPVAFDIAISSVRLTEETGDDEYTQNKSSVISTEVRLTNYAEREGHTGVIELWKKAETGDLKIAEHVYYIPKGKTVNFQVFNVKCLAVSQLSEASSGAAKAQYDESLISQFYVYERDQQIKSGPRNINCEPLYSFTNATATE